MDAGRVRERRAARRQGEREQYEARLRCKDGGAGWVIVGGSIIEENGEYAGTFSLMTDITSDDLDFLYALDGDPDVVQWTNLDGKRAPYAFCRDVLLPRSLACYDKYPGYGYWVAAEKATGAFLGWFHFGPTPNDPDEIELGYRLRKSAWGLGYATEGSRALVRKGFLELGTERVTATALAANRASVRVMEKAGLRFDHDCIHEHTDPETGLVTGHPAIKYALDSAEFEA